MCEGCPLQSIADFRALSKTELTIWHERTNQPDRVTLSVTRQGEQFTATGCQCREVVATLLTEMDAAISEAIECEEVHD
jgi:hypothetical protein